jgi:organic radical activating enzyme
MEIFSSAQGEGILVGRRQIFVRLAGCNLKCNYCDTPFTATNQCNVEQAPGGEKFVTWDNPVSLAQLSALIGDWLAVAPHSHHSLSITGGEPLLHAQELLQWLPQLSKLLPLQLETNGTLCAELTTVLPWLRWVVMDFKLASQTGAVTPWQQHREFLAIAAQVNCCVKVVVGRNTPDAELEQVAQIVAQTAANVPIILQPCTIEGRCSVAGGQLLAWQELMAKYRLDVRVIPQTHCYLAML